MKARKNKIKFKRINLRDRPLSPIRPIYYQDALVQPKQTSRSGNHLDAEYQAGKYSQSLPDQ